MACCCSIVVGRCSVHTEVCDLLHVLTFCRRVQRMDEATVANAKTHRNLVKFKTFVLRRSLRPNRPGKQFDNLNL